MEESHGISGEPVALLARDDRGNIGAHHKKSFDGPQGQRAAPKG